MSNHSQYLLLEKAEHFLKYFSDDVDGNNNEVHSGVGVGYLSKIINLTYPSVDLLMRNSGA